MDVELAKTIAAFGALTLGFVILALLTCKVYLYSPKLAAKISKATIRAVEAGIFDCQIDLDINAKGGEIYLKELAISHPAAVFDPDRGVNKRSIDRLVECPSYCALDEHKETFPRKTAALLGKTFGVAGTKLLAGERKRVSAVARISVVPSADGYWSWPTQGWTLTFKTSAGNVKIPLAFSVHESSEVNAFCRDYSPAGTMVWSC